MSPSRTIAAAVPDPATAPQDLVGSPLLWAVTIAAIVVLLLVDFAITRRPHEVSMREAAGWSAFYVAIPVGFGGWVWAAHGGGRALEYYTGYLVEKSLSIDNLFVFMLLLAAFAVPRALQQRALLIGVAGALVMRGAFIALGARLISSFAWAFLLFGAILLATALKVLRDAMSHHDQVIDPGSLRSVRLVRRLWPVTQEYAGPRLTVVEGGRRMLTPMALVVVAILGTDVVFAVDSVPAVYGITGDPYLVFTTNAFALLGLRALYFVLERALSTLRHLGFGLAAILGLIGVKLVLHWAHGVWTWVPQIPTLLSLALIIGVLAVVTLTSLRAEAQPEADEGPGGSAARGRRAVHEDGARRVVHAVGRDRAEVEPGQRSDTVAADDQ